MTIVGTRPEIIRLASVLKKLDRYCNHILVHTGQNYDYELNEIFFKELDLRSPDYILSVKDDKLYNQLGNIISETGKIIEKVMPDAILVLGDTNSALSVLNAKRFKIPIYHMEAGDRSFDEDVPEEINRRVVDHISDILLPYTEYSRSNLLREGIHPSRVYVTGSPIKEVYESIQDKICNSKIMQQLNLTHKKFITASIHREENVDKENGLERIVESYNALSKKYNIPIIISTHPRTKARLNKLGLSQDLDNGIIWHKPFGLIDFLALQVNSFCVVSDSGTIHEDSSILNFPAVAIRKSTEKLESIEAGHCIITGLNSEDVLRAVDIVTQDPIVVDKSPMPLEYTYSNVSSKIVRIILGMNNVVNELVWGKS